MIAPQQRHWARVFITRAMRDLARARRNGATGEVLNFIHGNTLGKIGMAALLGVITSKQDDRLTERLAWLMRAEVKRPPVPKASPSRALPLIKHKTPKTQQAQRQQLAFERLHRSGAA